METISINFKYRGAAVEGNIYPEENYTGLTYRVELNDQYAFTLYVNDMDEYMILRENNAIPPAVDEELLNKILFQLKRQLKYAA